MTNIKIKNAEHNQNKMQQRTWRNSTFIKHPPCQHINGLSVKQTHRDSSSCDPLFLLSSVGSGVNSALTNCGLQVTAVN